MNDACGLVQQLCSRYGTASEPSLYLIVKRSNLVPILRLRASATIPGAGCEVDRDVVPWIVVCEETAHRRRWPSVYGLLLQEVPDR